MDGVTKLMWLGAAIALLKVLDFFEVFGLVRSLFSSDKKDDDSKETKID